MKRKTNNPEYQLQSLIFEFLKIQLNKDALVTCFPSGGGGKIRGAMLKRMGLVAGWPDLQIIHKGMYYGLEVKTEKGKVSENQKAIHDSLKKQGAKVAVVRTPEQAWIQIKEWGLGR